MEVPRQFYRMTGTDLATLWDHPTAGVLLPGQVAVWFAKSLGAGLRAPSRPFLIEPATWALTKPPAYISKEDGRAGASKAKLSFVKMAKEILGGPFGEAVGKKKLSLAEVTGPSLEAATDKWIAFQKNYTSSVEASRLSQTLLDYDELADGRPKRPVQTRTNEAEWITGLSFPTHTAQDAGFRKTISSVERVKSSTAAGKAMMLLHVEGWTVGDVEVFDEMASQIPPGVAVELWIDGHSDYGKKAELSQYVEITRALSKTGRDVLLAYSSFFGALLGPSGVRGFVSGLGFSEDKESTEPPASGGGYSRYYVPLSSRPERTAECRLFFSTHPEEFCKDTACLDVLGRRPRTIADFDAFFDKFWNPVPKEHFVAVRQSEMDKLKGLPASKVSSWLRDRFERAVALNYEDAFERVPHWLKIWADVHPGS